MDTTAINNQEKKCNGEGRINAIKYIILVRGKRAILVLTKRLQPVKYSVLCQHEHVISSCQI